MKGTDKVAILVRRKCNSCKKIKLCFKFNSTYCCEECCKEK